MRFIILSICLLFSAIPSKAADFTVGPIDYEIVSLKEKTAKPVAVNQHVDILDIPYTVEYEGVVFTVPYISRIGGVGFNYYYKGVKEVILHEGLNKLGGAFIEFTSLETISFPSTLKTIGESYGGTFRGCTSLKEITIPETVDSISGAIFEDCINLKSVNFRGNPLFVYKGAYDDTYATGGVFKNCKSLQNIDLPQNIKVLGAGFFWGCYNLESVDLPNNCSAICDNAFRDCVNLKTFTFPEHLMGIGYNAFDNSGLSGNIQLPDNIRRIDGNAFSDCKNITSFTFPNNCCLEVGTYVLGGCSNLESVTFQSNGGIFKERITDSELIREVNCLSYYPPTVSDNFFPIAVMLKASLNIISGASNEYANSPQWGNFINHSETYENPGFCKFEIVLDMPDEYKSVFEIVYPERETTIQNGNSVKIDISHTSLGFESYEEFVPYFNGFPICMSETFVNHSLLGLVDKPYDIIENSRFYVTPPITKDATFSINFESSGIYDILANDEESANIEIYSLSGALVKSSLDKLSKGIYIIRRAKFTSKVIIR